jgi:type IV pilus assembly protein PilE
LPLVEGAPPRVKSGTCSACEPADNPAPTALAAAYSLRNQAIDVTQYSLTPAARNAGKRRAAHHRGFTLIEVMIVVAIVAILASVALPSYFDYVRRGQLPEAQAALSDFRVKIEQYYQDNRNYGTAQCADVGPPNWSAGNGTLNYGAAQFFTYSCTLSGGGQGYTVLATGANGRAVGHNYTIDHNNARVTTKFKAATLTKSCWLVKGSEC